jgi:hypothetical protein
MPRTVEPVKTVDFDELLTKLDSSNRVSKRVQIWRPWNKKLKDFITKKNKTRKFLKVFSLPQCDSHDVWNDDHQGTAHSWFCRQTNLKMCLIKLPIFFIYFIFSSWGLFRWRRAYKLWWFFLIGYYIWYSNKYYSKFLKSNLKHNFSVSMQLCILQIPDRPNSLYLFYILKLTSKANWPE